MIHSVGKGGGRHLRHGSPSCFPWVNTPSSTRPWALLVLFLLSSFWLSLFSLVRLCPALRPKSNWAENRLSVLCLSARRGERSLSTEKKAGQGVGRENLWGRCPTFTHEPFFSSSNRLEIQNHFTFIGLGKRGNSATKGSKRTERHIQNDVRILSKGDAKEETQSHCFCLYQCRDSLS